MGKTFVEDERPCDLCVNVTRYGCVSWNCEYINRDEAIKAWREKHETADRKTSNSSEIPTGSTISKMEQVETMSCQECKHFHENAVMYLDQCDFCFQVCKYEPTDEPQTEQTDCPWK